MATTQTAIAATTTAANAVGQNTARRFLYIKNYANVPSSQSAQTGSIYVAFGTTATKGTAGELELVPGAEYIFGGPLPPRVGNLPKGFVLPACPTEAISVLASSGTVYGAVMEQ